MMNLEEELPVKQHTPNVDSLSDLAKHLSDHCNGEIVMCRLMWNGCHYFAVWDLVEMTYNLVHPSEYDSQCGEPEIEVEFYPKDDQIHCKRTK